MLQAAETSSQNTQEGKKQKEPGFQECNHGKETAIRVKEETRESTQEAQRLAQDPIESTDVSALPEDF